VQCLQAISNQIKLTSIISIIDQCIACIVQSRVDQMTRSEFPLIHRGEQRIPKVLAVTHRFSFIYSVYD